MGQTFFWQFKCLLSAIPAVAGVACYFLDAANNVYNDDNDFKTEVSGGGAKGQRSKINLWSTRAVSDMKTK